MRSWIRFITGSKKAFLFLIYGEIFLSGFEGFPILLSGILKI
jgi:hypothetical protein